MVSGPGCPVCITPNEVHEACLDLVDRKGKPHPGFIRRHDPGPDPERLSADGRARSLLPPQDRLFPRGIAGVGHGPMPDKEVVFFGAGFETTIPAIAVTVKRATDERVGELFRR